EKWLELDLGDLPPISSPTSERKARCALMELRRAVEARFPGGRTTPSEPKRRKRGRPSARDAAQDKSIADAWASGQHKDYEALGRELHLTKKDIEHAIDAHRQREKRKAAPSEKTARTRRTK